MEDLRVCNDSSPENISGKLENLIEIHPNVSEFGEVNDDSRSVILRVDAGILDSNQASSTHSDANTKTEGTVTVASLANDPTFKGRLRLMHRKLLTGESVTQPEDFSRLMIQALYQHNLSKSEIKDLEEGKQIAVATSHGLGYIVLKPKECLNISRTIGEVGELKTESQSKEVNSNSGVDSLRDSSSQRHGTSKVDDMKKSCTENNSNPQITPNHKVASKGEVAKSKKTDAVEGKLFLKRKPLKNVEREYSKHSPSTRDQKDSVKSNAGNSDEKAPKSKTCFNLPYSSSNDQQLKQQIFKMQSKDSGALASTTHMYSNAPGALPYSNQVLRNEDLMQHCPGNWSPLTANIGSLKSIDDKKKSAKRLQKPRKPKSKPKMVIPEAKSSIQKDESVSVTRRLLQEAVKSCSPPSTLPSFVLEQQQLKSSEKCSEWIQNRLGTECKSSKALSIKSIPHAEEKVIPKLHKEKNDEFLGNIFNLCDTKDKPQKKGLIVQSTPVPDRKMQVRPKRRKSNPPNQRPMSKVHTRLPLAIEERLKKEAEVFQLQSAVLRNKRLHTQLRNEYFKLKVTYDRKLASNKAKKATQKKAALETLEKVMIKIRQDQLKRGKDAGKKSHLTQKADSEKMKETYYKPLQPRGNKELKYHNLPLIHSERIDSLKVGKYKPDKKGHSDLQKYKWGTVHGNNAHPEIDRSSAEKKRQSHKGCNVKQDVSSTSCKLNDLVNEVVDKVYTPQRKRKCLETDIPVSAAGRYQDTVSKGKNLACWDKQVEKKPTTVTSLSNLEIRSLADNNPHLLTSGNEYYALDPLQRNLNKVPLQSTLSSPLLQHQSMVSTMSHGPEQELSRPLNLSLKPKTTEISVIDQPLDLSQAQEPPNTIKSAQMMMAADNQDGDGSLATLTGGDACPVDHGETKPVLFGDSETKKELSVISKQDEEKPSYTGGKYGSDGRKSRRRRSTAALCLSRALRSKQSVYDKGCKQNFENLWQAIRNIGPWVRPAMSHDMNSQREKLISCINKAMVQIALSKSSLRMLDKELANME